MSAYAWLAVHDAAAFAAATYLIVNDHPWWAALCFFMIMGTNVKGSAKERNNDQAN